EVDRGKGSWGRKFLMRVRDAIKGFVEIEGGGARHNGGTVYWLAPWWRFIWDNSISPKQNLLLWLVTKGKLYTKDRLLKFGIMWEGSLGLVPNYCRVLCPWAYLLKEWQMKVTKGRSLRVGV
ncbi:hypothetical protein Dimus_007578, partial [Dionaea muscipula]